MRAKLVIGSPTEGGAFTLPSAIVATTTAVIGIRGSGKTNTGVVLTEELLGLGHQVVIIDPLDVWFGLKSSADGAAEGYPVTVLGGPHGDLPLDADSGRILADFAVESRAPLVLSLRHLRKGKQRQFVTDFSEQLYHRKGEAQHRVPLLVVIDEASTFIPQRVGGGEARMVGAVEDLVRRGRASGLGVVAIDQRPASVNKDVLTQLEIMVAHQVTSPQDTKALDEWVRLHDTRGVREMFLRHLPSLTTGEAYVWSPGLDVFERVQVRMRRTFDSSRTPELGEELKLPERRAAVDLAALRERLETTIAEAEANDPRALQGRIAELERELRTSRREAPAPDPRQVARAVQQAEAPLRARIDQLEEVVSRLEATKSRGAGLAQDLVTLLRNGYQPDPPGDAIDPGRGKPVPTKRPVFEGVTEYRSEEGKVTVTRRRPAAARAEGVSVPQQRILDTLASLEPIGLETPDRSTVAVLADQSPRSSSYANNLGRLRSLGLIDYPAGGALQLTDTGREAANQPDPPRSLGDLHRAWFARISAPQCRILEELIRIYPESLDRDELAELAGQSERSSGYANNLGYLRNSLGLIDYPMPGRVVATALLFPKGLR